MTIAIATDGLLGTIQNVGEIVKINLVAPIKLKVETKQNISLNIRKIYKITLKVRCRG